MRLFVSYSRRDGSVTVPMLRMLELHLRGVSQPFVHCLHEGDSKWEQVFVLKQLIRSHAVLVVESPAANTSRWVRLELLIARLLMLPVVRIHASDLVPHGLGCLTTR